MKEVVVYQRHDTLDVFLDKGSVNLIISSVPLDILSDRIDVFFRWCDYCLAPGGVIIVDAPSIYHTHNYSLNRYSVDLKKNGFPFRLEFSYALYDFYKKGDVQGLYFYCESELETLFKIPYKKWNEREMIHPCEFDHLLIEFLIERYSKEGDVVLDPFCGAGTVPKIAYRMGRNGIGVDRRCPFTNQLPDE